MMRINLVTQNKDKTNNIIDISKKKFNKEKEVTFTLEDSEQIHDGDYEFTFELDEEYEPKDTEKK